MKIGCSCMQNEIVTPTIRKARIYAFQRNAKGQGLANPVLHVDFRLSSYQPRIHILCFRQHDLHICKHRLASSKSLQALGPGIDPTTPVLTVAHQLSGISSRNSGSIFSMETLRSHPNIVATHRPLPGLSVHDS